jgi:acetyl-CoA carboxylase alpha subunit
VENALQNALKPLAKMDARALVQKRRQKFLGMGKVGL